MTRRVAITAAADRSEEVADHFRVAGLVPVALPCIRVLPGRASALARARKWAEGADLVVLTSWRPLDLLWGEGALPDVPVAAVGEATAGRVRERGARVVSVGGGGAVSLLERMDLAGRVVVYPHGEGADPRFIAALRSRAGDLKAVPVYRTEPVAPGPDPVDAAAFASPSAVRGWLSARSLDGLVVGAIGATTAAALAERGIRADVVPERPGWQALAEAIAACLPVGAGGER